MRDHSVREWLNVKLLISQCWQIWQIWMKYVLHKDVQVVWIFEAPCAILCDTVIWIFGAPPTVRTTDSLCACTQPSLPSTSLQFYMLKQSSKYICQNQQHSICLCGCYLPPSHPPCLILCLQAWAVSTPLCIYKCENIGTAQQLPIRGRIRDSIQLSRSS